MTYVSISWIYKCGLVDQMQQEDELKMMLHSDLVKQTYNEILDFTRLNMNSSGFKFQEIKQRVQAEKKSIIFHCLC